MFLTIAFCIRHCGRNKSGNSAQHDLDAFNRNFEDDDDELLDPSRDTPTAPQLVFEGEKDHTSFPPYNTGSGAEGFYGDNPWNTPSWILVAHSSKTFLLFFLRKLNHCNLSFVLSHSSTISSWLYYISLQNDMWCDAFFFIKMWRKINYGVKIILLYGWAWHKVPYYLRA